MGSALVFKKRMVGSAKSQMTGDRLRELFFDYFRSQKHVIIPSASLIPENDPTVLFTTAGMHPLVPYLRGTQPHPGGPRLANAQKCLRTDDLEEVGDASHLTFFEMLGNWSLGNYFKAEAIAMSFEFLTADRWLGIPKEKLAVTCFAGDADAPRDEESAGAWRRHGIKNERILFFGKQDNWWGPAGKTGPCGPDTEMFYDTGRGPAAARPGDDSGRFVEIWNDVFMEFEKTDSGSVRALAQKNVDTGMGLERMLAVLTGVASVYETDLFLPLVRVIQEHAPAGDERSLRIAVDHLRAAVFVLADRHDVTPSNVERGYVLRRLIRRALRALRQRGASESKLRDILLHMSDATARVYGSVYPEVRERAEHVKERLLNELPRYLEIERRAATIIEEYRVAGAQRVSSAAAFRVYQETGVHPDLLDSFGGIYRIEVDRTGLDAELEKHQRTSRAGITQRFQGGLADHADRTVRMHTATHLLHAALRHVLGTHVQQRGSNITVERLRFDFSHPTKLTEEELRRVEGFVNEQIRRDLSVTKDVMTPEEAKRSGALGFFEEKYGDRVNVYTVGDISKEICGGPHVSRTGDLGQFRIVKEEGLSAGIRRIRAVVEG